MCDFHSIVVRRDGAIAHLATNSHSGAIQAAGWRENDQMADLRDAPRFVEAEWEARCTKFPGVEKVTRGIPNEKQAKAIKDHYEALCEVLHDPAAHGENYCLGTGRFAPDEYADVRWKVMIHPNCPKQLVPKLAKTRLFAGGDVISSLHPSITAIEGSFTVAEGVKIDAPALVKSGSVVVSANATFTAPALAEVSGYVVVSANATFTAPKLKR